MASHSRTSRRQADPTLKVESWALGMFSDWYLRLLTWGVVGLGTRAQVIWFLQPPKVGLCEPLHGDVAGGFP